MEYFLIHKSQSVVKSMKSLIDVFNYIDQNADEFVETLRRFLRMPAVSRNIEDCKKAAEVLRDIMIERGISAKVMPLQPDNPDIGGPVVYAEIPGKKEKALIGYAHYDDKPVEPLEEWITPPYSADLREGPYGPTIYARGASDNKMGCLAFVFAAEAFMNTRGAPPVTLKLVFEGEEEIGSPHLEKWARTHREMLKSEGLHSLDGSLTEKGKPKIGIHGKAVLAVELKVKGPKVDVHASSAAIVQNPMWRLVQALSTIKDVERDEILIPGFYDDWREPTAEDLEYIRREMEDFDEEAVKKTYGLEGRPFPGNRTGFELFKELRFGITCTLTELRGGSTVPVIPTKASAKLGFRLPPYLDPIDLFEKLKAHLKKQKFDDIEVILTATRPNPWFTAPTEEIVQAMNRAAEKVYPDEDTQIGTSTTAEGIFSVALGIPSVMTGFANPDCDIHAPNENIAVSYFIKGLKFAATIMEEFAVE